MAKRRQTGDGPQGLLRRRRSAGTPSEEYALRSIFNVTLSLLTLSTLAISACNPEQPATNTDTVTSVASGDQDIPMKSLSVTPPNSPVPQQVADSIWDGDYIEKYPNGVIKKRGYIKGGLASGEWITFYEDGKPYSRGTYRNGHRIGYGVSWYHDGQKSSEGYYNLGKPVGLWKYWSEQGRQLVTKDYGGVLPDTTAH
jgi:hypothetical protein